MPEFQDFPLDGIGEAIVKPPKFTMDEILNGPA